MAPEFRVLYKVVGTCEIFADVYLPRVSPSSQQQPCPTALIFHGGAFCLGHSSMVSMDQVQDMLERGWIVVSPEHRLCPQVDILEGPITDARNCLEWVYDGSLEREISKYDSSLNLVVDHSRVVAVGTSSGGTLALALGFGVKKKVAAILDFYGATDFSDGFWTKPLPNEKPLQFPLEFINQVYDEKPIPTRDDVSLEGQSENTNGAPVMRSRVAFTLMHIANGKLIDVCFPSKEFEKIDASHNVDTEYPPTCIVHGTADTKVPMYLSQQLFEKLRKAGVKCDFVEVPGEEHTFVGKMKKGSKIWDIQRTGFNWLEERIKR